MLTACSSLLYLKLSYHHVEQWNVIVNPSCNTCNVTLAKDPSGVASGLSLRNHGMSFG